MQIDGVERRLAAILSADVVGYSRLISEDEDGTVRRLAAYRDQIDLIVEQHGGRVVDFTGDNFLAEFSSAVNATRCALEIQRVLEARNAGLAEDRQMLFRMGIHLGEVRAENERIFGDGVNIAARLEALSAPGGLCISGSVYDQVGPRLPLDFDDLGGQELKNIPGTVRAFAVRGDHKPVPPAEKASGDELPSIAVLPFNNMSGDPEQEFFADGMTEDIITELARFNDLKVVARNTTFQFKGQSVDVRRVGAELESRYVVEGSVRTAGNRIRVTAQLLDGKSGAHLWAEAYDRELTPENIFAVQDDIKEKIVAVIADAFGVISATALDRGRREAPETLTAYEAVLLARTFYREGSTPELHLRVRAALERAVELEPSYSDAWAWLAVTHRIEYEFHYNRRDGDPLARTAAAARRSLDLDPANRQALMAVAIVHAYRHEIEEFRTMADRALALNPNSPQLHMGLGLFMSYAGWDRGGELAYRALELLPDPPTWVYLPIALDHYRRGEDEEALDFSRRVNMQGWNIAYVMRAAACGQLGRTEEGSRELGILLERHPNIAHTLRDHWLRKYNVPEPMIERIVDGLRKAGLEIPDEGV